MVALLSSWLKTVMFKYCCVDFQIFNAYEKKTRNNSEINVIYY